MFAISYDPQAGLREFAAKYGIAYPLLSDEGSAVIRELGVLDEDLTAHHATFDIKTRDEQQGVAYPMTFILDGSGRVERKIVEPNYRLRQGGRLLFEQLTGAQPQGAPDAIEVRGRTAHVALRAWLDSPTYFAYQRLGLHIELTIDPGWHVYGPTTPSGYQALEITAASEPAGARLGPIPWPRPTDVRVQGLDEDFAVYEGSLDLVIPVELIIARGSGDARLDIAVRTQSCSATECQPPASIGTSLVIPEAPTL